jgi:hypothetical protein
LFDPIIRGQGFDPDIQGKLMVHGFDQV